MVDPIREMIEDLANAVEKARSAGVAADAIVVDPGIGFGKTAEDSLKILKNLD